MADISFNTTEGQVVDRELLLLFLNTGTSTTPTWSVIGKRVEESSAEYDYGTESKRDILGDTYTTGRKPIITQSFDPCELDAGDPAQVFLWNKAVKDQDVAALTSLDLLVVHRYATYPASSTSGGVFAERYPASSIVPTGLGGGGNVGMPISVTFGGKRSVGSATFSGSTVTFTADT